MSQQGQHSWQCMRVETTWPSTAIGSVLPVLPCGHVPTVGHRSAPPSSGMRPLRSSFLPMAAPLPLRCRCGWGSRPRPQPEKMPPTIATNHSTQFPVVIKANLDHTVSNPVVVGSCNGGCGGGGGVGGGGHSRWGWRWGWWAFTVGVEVGVVAVVAMVAVAWLLDHWIAHAPRRSMVG
jgi:hypothetical protein